MHRSTAVTQLKPLTPTHETLNPPLTISVKDGYLCNGQVKWKAGDYVMVWNREEKSHARSEGFGFNLATGEIGNFNTISSSLKVIN